MARAVALACAAALALLACSPYEYRHDVQWDARSQIWLSESSQVKVRAAQSRVFDTRDRRAMLESVVTLFQDLGFQIEVLDEALGIVSGKKFVELEKPRLGADPSYYLYDDENLVVFTRSFRKWGPFWHRSDLVRLTVTVRDRNEQQLVVRASAQFYLRPIEDPEPYQQFFAALDRTRFGQAETERGGRSDRPAPSLSGRLSNP
jgi:hypothetical protein